MLPFTVVLRAGLPIHEQVVYAVRRAAVTGQLRPGDPFPSVRALSLALRINPNTAHKIVSTLTDEGLLVVKPGIGTFVGTSPPGDPAARRAILEDDAERIAIEAQRAGVSLKELLTAIKRHWTNPRDSG